MDWTLVMAKGFCDGLVVWKRYQQNELRKPHGFKALAVVSFTTGPASNIGTTDPFFQPINYSLHAAVFSGVKPAVDSSTARTQNKYW